MLTSILSRPSESSVIPTACRYDESRNIGRVHKEHHHHSVYSLSRRLTKSLAPAGVVAEFPAGAIHHNDKPQKGEISLGECRRLAEHLQLTFGVLNLLPRTCNDMLQQARDATQRK
mmetsp:Transcript_13092/g.38036  ORF Transcript_13092/g.38036 Transcript_13092/m.38036 type:complete len:116 (+) Transcript_13092:143-490(+)